MQVETSLDRIADLSEAERAEVRGLSRAIYPAEETEDWPGRQIEWSEFEWCVRVWEVDGRLVSYVGVLVREARYIDQQVLVGGVGGVGTHPAARRRGYAGIGLARAVGFFSEEAEVDFALLVCRAELIKYYSHLGWREFDGQLLVRQYGEQVEFTFNQVMTIGIGRVAPTSGIIDLQGPPW